MPVIDPRLKILWFILYSIIIFTSENLPSQLMLMAFTILGIWFSRHKLAPIIKKVRYLLYFLPLTFGIHLFFTTDFFLLMFQEGLTGTDMKLLILPTYFTLRMADFIIFMSWILVWIEADSVLDSVYYILKPLEKLRIPVDELFQVIFIALRFFPILQEEYRRLNASWDNFTNKNQEENRFMKLVNILVTLVIFSFRKADKIALSMYIRGYGKRKRTYYSDLKFHFSDLIYLSFFILFFIMVKKVDGVFGKILV